MNSPDPPKLPVTVDIAARAEAKLEVKAEVPAESTGRLLDALTDIIRPFSESRGLRADTLRLQREEVAIQIAQLAQNELPSEKGNVGPVPTKILVPLIEKGSCEDPNDSEMLDRWANLLASASLKIAVQPRFVGILGELAGSQAQCIEHIAFNDFERFAYPGRDFESSYLEYGEHDS